VKRSALLSAVLTAALAVFLTGCSRNPVAPSTGTTMQPGAGTAVVGAVPDDPPSSDGGTPITRTVALTATDEGAITVGRFTLWVRKNSLKMPATITLKVTDEEATECQIDVQPAAANNFQSPVILYANTSDIANFDYSTGTMMVLNGSWQFASDCSAHPNQENVVGHFTTLSNVKLANANGKGKDKFTP